jgi:tetratricopeptide (TPR) repeat protein
MRDKSTDLSKKRDYNLKAIQSFLNSTEDDKNHYEAWYNLGNAYYYNGSFRDALEAYNNSTKHFPNGESEYKSWVSFNIGNCYYMLGKFYKAEENYTYAIDNKISYLNAYNNRALARIEQDKFDDALADLKYASSELHSNGKLRSSLEEENGDRLWPSSRGMMRSS